MTGGNGNAEKRKAVARDCGCSAGAGGGCVCSRVEQPPAPKHGRGLHRIGAGVFQLRGDFKTEGGVDVEQLFLIAADRQAQLADVGGEGAVDQRFHQMLRQTLAAIAWQDAHAQDFPDVVFGVQRQPAHRAGRHVVAQQHEAAAALQVFGDAFGFFSVSA
jgi:hypothetical protein